MEKIWSGVLFLINDLSMSFYFLPQKNNFVYTDFLEQLNKIRAILYIFS